MDGFNHLHVILGRTEMTADSITVVAKNNIFLPTSSDFVLSLFSCVRLFVTLWTVACQASLSTGILQARILEWVAKPSSRGSS